MDSALKTAFRVLRPLLLPLILVIFVGAPSISLGEEDGATTISELSPTATTTGESVSPLVLPAHTTTTDGEVAGTSTTDTVQNAGEQTEGTAAEELAPPTADLTPPPPPLLSRVFKKHITVDRRAQHSCEAQTFRIDLSGKTSAQVRIILHQDTDFSYEVEIGALPLGINVTFSKNGAYRYAQSAGERVLQLSITNEQGSQKGDFIIPIIYTRDDSGSSAICQLNIVNK